MAIFLYLLLCLVPAGMFELMARALHRWSSYDDPRPVKSKVRRQPSHDSKLGRRARIVSGAADCDRYRSDLRRLAETYDQLQAAQVPVRARRMRAVEMAYDDILRDACVAYDLDRPPEHLDAMTRLQIEADLLTAGLRW